MLLQKNGQTGYPSVDKPWLKYYSEEAIKGQLPECTIYEYLWINNKDYPKDIAIDYYGRRVTFGELFDSIDSTAKGFAAIGVKKGDIVTVALPSIPEALYVIYALNRLGAVANMIHPLAGRKEILHYIQETESRIVVVFDGAYEIIGQSIGETCVEHAVVVSAADSLPKGRKMLYSMKQKRVKLPAGSPYTHWKHFIRSGKNVILPDVKKDPHEMAVISHTGGTTGDPKGVMCSDVSINALIYQIVLNFEYTRQETCLVVLPPFVNYSLIESMLAMLHIGFTVALIPQYIPLKFGEYIKKYKPYVIFSIPAYWEALLKIRNIESVDMSCLRYCLYGGEAMGNDAETEINALLQKCSSRGRLFKGIGSTEMMAAATATYENCNEIGSAGVPLVWVNCKITEPDTLNELSYNQEGEICFTGPTLMLGYYHKPDETNEVVKLHADGYKWLHTGDIGYINENGTVYITGRIKRIIMTRGNDGNITKMFPDRIEKAIYRHPGVEQCCVIGVPDEGRINYPKAFVVLKNKNQTDHVKDEIREKCAWDLPTYMIPEEIQFVNDMPRTPRGKIDYRALEKNFQE